MATLILSIIPLAIGAAVSPLLFGIEILALTSGQRVRIRAWLVVLGAAAVLVAFCLVGLLAGHALPHHTPHRKIDGAVDLVAAVLLGVLAARTLAGARSASPKPTILDRLQGASTATFLGAGAIGMVTNLSTLVLFVPAFRMITKSAAGTAAEVLAFAVLLGITLLPVIAPALLVTVLGDRANGVLGRMNRAMTAHSAQITAGIEVLFAVLLTARGISSLL
jgi:hypothetical protein